MLGSTTNIMLDRSFNAKPIVGMGATELCYSDRHAYTIIEILSDGYIKLKRDRCVRIDNNGLSDSEQEYICKPDPYGDIVFLSLRKDGSWIRPGQTLKNGTRFFIGERLEYYDYSF